MDSGDKASNKAMSVGHKYAFLQALCIPTVEPKDPENDSQDLRGKHDKGPQPGEDKSSAQSSRPVDLSDRHKKVLAHFTEVGVAKEILEKVCGGKPFGEFKDAEFAAIKVIAEDIKAGKRTAKEVTATFSALKPSAAKLTSMFPAQKAANAPGVGTGS
jgi:hypothetical protein